ncbi:hypothetical protein ONS96_004480 [Cadophora gregata f. sp. sojae]|nr:hypothetical protein ONS96_004480 [Cadophora gregata f. sp. sojae]
MQLSSILLLVIHAAGVLSAPSTTDESFAPDFANSSIPPPGPEWENYIDSANPLKARGCVSNAPYGCDLGRGRCWKVCGDHGEWCWTAEGDGGGNWHTCSDWGACNTGQNCGKNCHNAAECGCSC